MVTKEKLKGSILGLLGGNAIVSNITLEVPEKVNQYINTNGKELICSMVEKEISKICTILDIEQKDTRTEDLKMVLNSGNLMAVNFNLSQKIAKVLK